MIDLDQRFNMGMSPCLSGGHEWPMTHRFLFYSENRPELNHLVQGVTLDLFNRKLELRVLESSPAFATQDWVMGLAASPESTDRYTVLALNALGECQYALEITGVTAESHKVGYAYAVSDVVAHLVSMRFETCERRLPTRRTLP